MQKLLFSRYLKRFFELGFFGALGRISHRSKRRIFALRWEKRALNRKANHNWKKISKTDFEMFFEKVKQDKTLERILENELFHKYASQEKIVEPVTPPNTFPNTFPNIFYQKIFPSNKKDIKDFWEPSRFNHLFFLEQESDQEFEQSIGTWIKANPFLIGVNWVCPMEVAIRAINWIFAFHKFKNSKTIPIKFWKKFFCSLYDHKFYLENNWETSDKPNNHYIADLVGHFFLSHFFDIKFNKRYKQILEQFDHQIQADGTSYEGSTAYHKLDTELFWLFALLCQAKEIKLSKGFYDKFEKMIEFCQTTQDIQVGDNDSGKILTGFCVKKSIPQGLFNYPNFGLTVINKKNFHITFRHATYKKHQPTGHFHQDELSVTVAIKGMPILVDSGSYLYTSNKTWRNLMRSYEMHNTFYSPHRSPHLPSARSPRVADIDLFQLPKEEFCDHEEKKRKIVFDEKKGLLEIIDLAPLRSYQWTFLFHPKIKLKKTAEKSWAIFHANKKIATFTSTLGLEKTTGYFSPKYGVIEECCRLSSPSTRPPGALIGRRTGLSKHTLETQSV